MKTFTITDYDGTKKEKSAHLCPKKMKLLPQMKDLLGKRVLVDYRKVRNRKDWSHIPDGWDGKPFESVVVGINRLNLDYGSGNNLEHVEIFPDHCGNWHSVDLRMITTIEDASQW